MSTLTAAPAVTDRTPPPADASATPSALRIGPITLEAPVVLAPMAGITNAAYRQLCREQGAGLYVCEMITSAIDGGARLTSNRRLSRLSSQPSPIRPSRLRSEATTRRRS